MLKRLKINDDIWSLVPLIVKDKVLCAEYLVSTILSSTISLCFPLALEAIADLSTQPDASGSVIFNTVGLWSIVYTIGAIATYCRRITAEKICLALSMQLKNDYFTELLKKKIDAYGEQQTGSLTQQLNKDINEISSIMTTEISSVMRGFAFLFFSLLFLVYNCAELTVFILLSMGVLGGVGAYYGKFLKKARGELANLTRELNSFTQEKFMQIKTVKLFTGESIELKAFSEREEKIKEQSLIVGEYTSRFYAIMEFLGENSVIWSAGYGVYLLHTTPYLTIGKLTAFGTYGVYTSMGFNLMVTGYTEIIKASGLYSNILQILSDKTNCEEIQTEQPKVLRKNVGVPVQMQAVSFTYPGREVPVLFDISVNIKSGEIWGIVGQSGNGKSTMFHLLTKLYSPDSGKILIDGVDIETQPAWWARQFISIVSQDALLFSVSILENIKYSRPNASFEEVEEACRRADALEFIENLPGKFNTQVGENGFSLSGGQRQRIAIARALLKEPQLLLLDEATSGLDGNSEASIQNIIEREVKKRGFTVIIITHRIHTLKGLTDYIALVKNGKITAAGTYEEISCTQDFQLLSRI